MKVEIGRLESIPLNGDYQEFDIFAQLKQSTAEVHRQVEDILPIFQAGFDREQYARLVERFYGIWAPLEVSLLQLDKVQDPELDLARRMKTSLLEKDLRILARDPAQANRCEILPAIDSFPHAIGVFTCSKDPHLEPASFLSISRMSSN